MAAPRPSGNKRTGQDVEFHREDIAKKTREEFDKQEKAEAKRNEATFAPDKAGMAVVDRAQRMGKTMTTAVLTAKLKAINPNFVVRRSKADGTKCGIYLPRWEQTQTGGWQWNLVHIMGCENTDHPLTGGVMPEFSIIDTVAETVPGPNGEVQRDSFRAETRGWRTVVAMLLIKGIITTHDVQAHFGLTPSKESARWHELMMTPLDTMAAEATPITKETIQ